LPELLCFHAKNAGWDNFIEKVGDMGLLSAHIWHNTPLLDDFQYLSGRINHNAIALPEKVIFCDYLT